MNIKCEEIICIFASSSSSPNFRGQKDGRPICHYPGSPGPCLKQCTLPPPRKCYTNHFNKYYY